MEKVRLLNVLSCSCETENGWREMYKIKIDISGRIHEIKSDLKTGVKNEIQKIFLPKDYDYRCFEAKYGRSPKEL